MMRLLKNVLFTVAGFLTARRLSRGPSTREHAPPEKAENVITDSRSELKTFLKRLGLLVPVLAVLGFLLAASGIIPLKASSGHWAVTEWFLNFGMERSVALHSSGIKVPPLDDPVLVLKGAGHYDFGCRPCHGGTERETPRIPKMMLPPPPFLPPQIGKFGPEELFYIIKHGEKFTGMPAWPAQSRDDEVWAVVAFLLRLQDMDEDAYRDLVEGEASRDDAQGARFDTSVARLDAIEGGPDSEESVGVKAAESAPVEGLLRAQGIPQRDNVPGAVTDRCGRCHGIDGGGREIGSFPRLDGQSLHYLFASLKAYKDGERHSGIMQPVAAGLSEDDMREISAYYSLLRASPASPVETDAAAVARGEQIAAEGIPARRVPSCRDCHGPGSLPRNPFYPHLAGQYAEYIKLQLELFKEEKRGGSVYARLMHPTADDLSEEQMRDVAFYYASLEAQSPDSVSSPAAQP